jgi:hypothetical protein
MTFLMILREGRTFALRAGVLLSGAVDKVIAPALGLAGRRTCSPASHDDRGARGDRHVLGWRRALSQAIAMSDEIQRAFGRVEAVG